MGAAGAGIGDAAGVDAVSADVVATVRVPGRAAAVVEGGGGATGALAVAAVGGAGGADDVVVSAGIVEAAAGATVAAAGAAAIELGVLEAVRPTPSPSSTCKSMTPSAVITSAAKRTASSTGNISRGRRPGLPGHLATIGSV